MSNLLSVENLTMKFGGLTAIDDLSFDAKNNQITSIIGGYLIIFSIKT